MNNSLIVELAQIQVARYRHDLDEVMKHHVEAMECRDCEEWLQKGIETFQWLQWAEKILRQADYEGLYSFTPEMRQTIVSMYANWLAPRDSVLHWVEELRAKGYLPDYVSEFETACDIADEIVQKRQFVEVVGRSLKQILAHEEW